MSKYHLSLFLYFIIIWQSAFSQIGSSVVKITSNIERGNGFGFIVYEKGNDIYFVTAKHIVIDDLNEKATKIQSRFYNGITMDNVEIVEFDEKYDVALLKTILPKRIRWTHRYYATDIEPGFKIGIVGRGGEWNKTEYQGMGTVTKTSYDAITADFRGSWESSSGGPVIDYRDRIVGMFYRETGTQISAIPIQLILSRVYKWLKISNVRYLELPYFNIGINSGLNTVNPAKKDFYAINNPRICYGFHFESWITERYSIQYNYSIIHFSSNSDIVSTVNFKNFYNKLNAHTMTLNMSIFNPLRFSAANAKFGLGLSYHKMNPILYQLDNTETPVSNLIDKNLNDAFSAKVNFSFNFYIKENLYTYLQFDFMMPFSKYIYTDITKTIDNQKRELIMIVQLGLGYSFRLQNTDYKVLKFNPSSL